jgi:protein phosphatase
MRCFFSLDEKLQADLLGEWESAVKKSHLTVRALAAEDPERHGMATTLTMVHVLWPHAYVVQVGDSRCYLLHEGRLRQVTRDQTVAQHLVDSGALPPENAARSPYSHVLSSAVGIEREEIEPVISRVGLEVGDSLLLCTDGLTKHVADEEIARHLLAADSAQHACETLMAAALDAGGTDNVTIVVSRYTDETSPSGA